MENIYLEELFKSLPPIISYKGPEYISEYMFSLMKGRGRIIVRYTNNEGEVLLSVSGDDLRQVLENTTRYLKDHSYMSRFQYLESQKKIA